MSNWSIGFAPLFPWQLIVALAILAGALALYGLFRRLRGGWFRLAAWGALTLAMFNPSLLKEDREPLKTVIAVVVDETDSQKFDGREKQTKDALAALKAELTKLPQVEMREISVSNGSAADDGASSDLFSGLKSVFQNVPPDQIGGAIMITDGQIHDVPKSIETLGFSAPVHGLITGQQDDRDRRLVIKQAPRFGIVGTNQELVYSVIDTNIEANGGLVTVQVLMDGEPVAVEQVLPGEDASFFFDVPHGGKNVIELRAETAEGEITPLNNQAFTVLEGIRENLRVLLVSGEPHAGERTWRNLLKSDASVDLVHFTILRPPEKQDGTPINQLSLIAFPTRELFIEKIDEFDLIIFDRYKRRGVLPVLYFDNIARYVTEGGAILIAAGPEHADITSVHRTPLASVLPVEPTGNITERAFHPTVSEPGRRHPVTRDLPGMQKPDSEEPPKWSRWFRHIDGANPQGDVIMNGAGDQPLLVLNRPGKGRIAMLMSDHVWLWARGFEGGGPHTQLLRRLGHWLMKEPELDEEALRAKSIGSKLLIERQTMGSDPGPVTITTPTGDIVSLSLAENGDGTFATEYEAKSLGLHRATNGDLTALTHVGPANPKEFADIVSTPDALTPIAAATGGLVKRIASNIDQIALPRIATVRGTGKMSGQNWIGLRSTDASILKGIIQIPLFSGFLGLGLLLLFLAGMWAREGR